MVKTMEKIHIENQTGKLTPYYWPVYLGEVCALYLEANFFT